MWSSKDRKVEAVTTNATQKWHLYTKNICNNDRTLLKINYWTKLQTESLQHNMEYKTVIYLYLRLLTKQLLIKLDEVICSGLL